MIELLLLLDLAFLLEGDVLLLGLESLLHFLQLDLRFAQSLRTGSSVCLQPLKYLALLLNPELQLLIFLLKIAQDSLLQF